jgi:hypothetical protein
MRGGGSPICAAAALACAALVAGCGGSDKTVSVPARPVPKQAVATVTVPSLTGARVADAERRLRSLGLAPRIVRRYASLHAGVVTKTRPPAGSQLPRGTRVALIVSLGPRPSQAQAPPSGGTSTPAAGHCGAGQYTRPNGTCAPIPPSNGGAPPANSPEGQQALRNNPDCQNAPPPPPGYTGPVQC